MSAPAVAPPVRAHLLLQVDPGHAQRAADHVAAVPDVSEAVQTTGPYDVIATVVLPPDHDLSAVLRRVRSAPGLCMLRVCHSR